MLDRVIVAAIQLTSTDNIDSNLERAELFVRQAATNGAQVVALPENFAYLRSENSTLPCAQTVEGQFIQRMQAVAKELGIYILCGSIPEMIPGSTQIYNSSVLLNRSGKLVAIYRKIHLFDIDMEGRAVFQESKLVKAGKEIVTTETEFGVVGLTVCYDLRFPELYRCLVLEGARIIFVPSAFTEFTGKDHWEVLLRARAIENQVFIIAPAQYGQHNSQRRSYGRTMIVDPWGNKLAQAPDRECVILAELDFTHQDEIRKQLPSLQHIKLT
ncbi:carbon-nitrogen hydrolase family protein [bacterium]|nr:carbon-nitrogen hydrolase family protein [bacterium]MCI0614154.1 carbon-nitrogen hydrolase family protein [bacterium]